MEGTKFQKPPQEYHYCDRRLEHRRVFRNKREDNPSGQIPGKENNQNNRSGGGKVNCVKPRYSPREQIKDSEMKPGMVGNNVKQDIVNIEQNKAPPRGKDYHVTGPHVKAHKTNFKDNERRKNPSKEKNSRPFKIPSNEKYQDKTKQQSTVDGEIKLTKDGHKFGNDLTSVKQKANTQSTAQYLKPAVHVQPLQQLPEDIKLGATHPQSELNHHHNQNNFNLVQHNSQLQLQHLLNQDRNTGKVIQETETKKERSLANGKIINSEQSSTLQEASDKGSAKLLQKIPVPSTTEKLRSSLHNDGSTRFMVPKSSSEKSDRTVLQNSSNAHSMAYRGSDNTKTLIDCVPSNFCSTLVTPAQLESSKTENLAVVNERLQSGSELHTPHEMSERQLKGPMEAIVTEKGKPLIERSQVSQRILELSPCEKSETKKPLDNAPNNSVLVQGPRCDLEHLKSLETLSNEKYGYRISVDSLFSTSFFTSSKVNEKSNKDLVVDTRELFENHKSETDKRGEIHVMCGQAPTVDMDANQAVYCFPETTKFNVANPDITQTKETPFLSPKYERVENFDVRLVSPRNRSGKASEFSPSSESSQSSHSFREHGKFILTSPRSDLSRKTTCEVESEYVPELINDPSFPAQDIKVQTYKNLPAKVKDTFCNRAVQNSNLVLFPNVESLKIEEDKGVPHSVHEMSHSEIVNEPERQLGNTNSSGMHSSRLVNMNYDNVTKHGAELQTNMYPGASKEDVPSQFPVTTENYPAPFAVSTDKTSLDPETQLHSSDRDKQLYQKQNESTIHSDADGVQVHRGTFSQGAYLPNPFLGHSLLTHRHAIPSAFVYPSRVGIPGGHSGFNDVAQHSGASPSAHLFPPHGTTVCVNVGGRLFEVLPSTFSSYPESLLYQIFTGAASAPISQRGHLFFDRDGYLFEIILAFARVGHLTLPPRVSLSSLKNEAKFFGMYDYMFQQGSLPSGSLFHFKRTTCCTLCFDISTNKSDTKVFVLQGEDKLKIESLTVNGTCHLYVDLYTPSGVKETSNFLLYDSGKPDLWKAYQFCAERQLVFHLGEADTGNRLDSNNPSVCVVFAQTFVFHGDEFLP